MTLAATVIGSVAALGLGLGVAAVATDGPGTEQAPGPNGDNTHGLCTAYFSGSGKGQEQKHQAPPFRALEEAAGGADHVAAWCAEHGSKPAG